MLSDASAYFLEGYKLTAMGLQQVEENSEPRVLKWRYETIREICRRRYLLQERAVEIFSIDGNNHIITFDDNAKRESVFNFIISKSPMLSETQDVVDSGPKVERESILSSFISGKSATRRWEQGEISNYEYLMLLNTMAGRSYNDLNQYPVFPWIIADYDSEELDLDDPCTYRDLGKPMGAQTPVRAESFKSRFEQWISISPDDSTPAFHYGTHYSSAAIVSSYLVRMEPFAKHFINLQGGHFDHPDRMFQSVKDSWLSASERNNGDVKELIPEFFYLPEFLTNSNRFDLGRKQNGEILDQVKLPTWAKGDPSEFVRVQRQALESEYVSSRLHEWIDLIFGYKQLVCILFRTVCTNYICLG